MSLDYIDGASFVIKEMTTILDKDLTINELKKELIDKLVEINVSHKKILTHAKEQLNG